MNDGQDQQVEEIEQPANAGGVTREGAVAEQPTTDEVAKMYDELGIKAPKPTDKSKGRPKTSAVRAKDGDDNDDADTKSERKQSNASESKSKDAPADDKDGDAGNDTDAKGAKVSKKDGEVSDESEETELGVRKTKSAAEAQTERGSEEDAESGADRTGQDADDSDDETEEGKRPGKSNPKVEQRFQRLTTEVRERDELIEKLRSELQETTQQREQAKIAQEDPEFTVEDFAKVRDEEGNIIDLDPERAELAWRRWKDGYEQRAEQRNAEANRQVALEQAQSEYSDNIMRQSVEAYDTLANLMDEYPELVSASSKFDASFASKAMPVIQEAIMYQEGTEPGNPEGNKAVIMGLKLNPKVILDALKGIQAEKRALPLNGLNDNVESRSNVNVQHSRSSDPTVNAANELYKSLKIDKRL